MIAMRRLLSAAPVLLVGVMFASGPAWAVEGEPAPGEPEQMECTTTIVTITTTTVNPDGSTTTTEETREETQCRAMWGH